MPSVRFHLSIFACTAIASGAFAQTVSSSSYYVEEVVTALSAPVQFTFVGPNDILVCEKNTGKIQKVVNGVIMGTVIDFNVANNSERGCLGICLDPNFASNGFVYVYYSRATVDGGTWLDNRVEKFVYNGATLAYDSTLLVIPTDASQSNGPNHDGGPIMVGPDNKLYLIVGDLNRGRFGGTARIEQNTATTGTSGVGGIIRMNLDGTIPSDNPFFSDPDPNIKRYYAYGIRNSYGLTWDTQTNYIWFSENGPTVYDEINVMTAPGMNSGWLRLMGPDSRNAVYGENNNTAYNASDLTMLSGAYYRDPEFSWVAPTGSCGLCFLTGNKMRPSERGKVLVGDSNFGSIYLFSPNATRDGFVLAGNLADKVADTFSERTSTYWGTGWNVATDMKVGPDGYLYICSNGNGKIYRIRPNIEDLAPESFSVAPGSVVSGGLTDLAESDDLRLVGRPGAVLIASQPPLQLTFNSTAPWTTCTQLAFSVESNGSVANIEQQISLLNQTTSTYEVVDTRTIGTSDGTATVTISSTPSRFINSTTRAVTAKVTCKTLGPVLVYPWQARFDKVGWTITK